MYRYYQRKQGQNERWHPVSDQLLNKLVESQTPMITVLSLSAIDNNLNPKEVTYQGQLYFDIDHADLKIAIRSAQTLVGNLQDLGAVTPQIFLSGKKGLHIMVSEKTFSTGKPTLYLPYIYGLIATKLDVDGLDHVVYSSGKGRMWRQPNILREDCGRYKVPITLEELYELTPESYLAYVSQPRTELKIKLVKSAAAGLMHMFIESKNEAIERMEAQDLFIFEPDERLVDFDLIDSPPTCLTNLVDGIGVKLANFNRAVMNFAGLMKIFGADQSVIQNFSERMFSHNNYNSLTYANEYKRENHIRQILRRAEHDQNIGFAASFLFSTIDQCADGCVLCDGTLSGRGRSEAELVVDNPIIEMDSCYFLRSKKSDRKLSTFTLSPECYTILYDEDEDINLRDSILASVKYTVKGVEQVIRREFAENVWNSNATFKKAVEGMGNVVWHGSDNDLMLLKHYIFSKDSDMNEIYKTQKVGLRIERHATGKSLVYVEPGHSINSFGERDTHKLTKNIPAPPRLMGLADLDMNNEMVMKTLHSLLKINAPHKVALMLGWYMSCHIKPHYQDICNQFPILCLWGNSGVGKTKVASLLGYLHAVDYEGSDAPCTLGGTTPWAAAEFVASSLSTPRLLDEFNRAKLEKGGRYNKIADLIKAAWGNQPHMRGTVNNTKSGGAEVISLHMSGPIVIMSEQQPDEPPILQRTVQCNLNRRDRQGCDDDWELVYSQRNTLAKLGKHCVMEALETHLVWVRERLKHWTTLIPSEQKLDSRPHYSFRVCFTGLDFFAKTLTNQLAVEESSDLIREIEKLQTALLRHINGNVETISKEKATTVSDRVISMIAVVAAESAENDNPLYRLENNVHYIKSGNDLYIDMPLAFMSALRFANSIRQPLEITSISMLKTLMRDEPYLLSTAVEVSFCKRPVWHFDIGLLDAKGVDVSLFSDSA